MKKSILSFLFLFTVSIGAFAQNIPSFQLLDSTYIFSGWDANTAAGTQPSNAIFQTFTENPANDNPPILGTWACSYNQTNRPRFVGLNNRGVGFIMTGNPNYFNCDSLNPIRNVNIGAMVVQLDARNQRDIEVSYTTALEIAAGGIPPRVATMLLQYRTDTTGNFTNLPAIPFTSLNAPVGDSLRTTLMLNEDFDGLPVIQLRWLYLVPSIPTTTGSRPMLRLDNIRISGTRITSVKNKLQTIPFSIFPNPSNGSFTLEHSANEKVSVLIADITGKTVQSIENVTDKITLTHFQKGIYTVTIMNEKGEKSTKMLAVR